MIKGGCPFRVFAALAVLITSAVAQRLESPTPRLDFGRVDRGTPVKGSFELRARGGALDIVATAIDCACGTLTLDASALEDGGATTLHVEVDTRPLEGLIDKRITLRYGKGPFPRTLTLRVVGEVVPSWRVKPDAVALGGLNPGQLIERTFDIKRRDRKIGLRCAPLPEGSQATITQRDGGLTLTVRGKVPVDATVGPWSMTVIVRSDDPIKPEQRVVLTGRVEGDIAIEPGVVRLGPLRSGVEHRTVVVVRSRSGTPFRLLRTLAAVPLSVIFKGKAAVRHEVTIVVPATLVTGRHRGRILLETDRDGERRLALNFIVRIDS